MGKLKYSEELKLKVVLEIIENKKSQKSVAKEYCICVGDIQKWLKAYESHGVEGLIIRQYNHRKYDGNFKLKVVKYKIEKGYSARQAAAHFNIASYTSVCQWEKKYLEGGSTALYKEKRGCSPRMPKKRKIKKVNSQIQTQEEMLEEIKMLKMENEYLKKLNALVLKREK